MKLSLALFAAASIAVLIACIVPSLGLREGADTTESVAHSAVVEDLVRLINSNATFKAQVEKVLSERGHPNGLGQFPTGAEATLDDMYAFFDDWLTYLSDVDNATAYTFAFAPYYTTDAGLALITGQPARDWLYKFVLARGEFMDSNSSARIIPVWEADSRINMDEFVVPASGFESFNQFFTRQFKAGERPISHEGHNNVAVSPGDCSIAKVDDGVALSDEHVVKGEKLNISRMLGGSPLAHHFDGGIMVHADLNLTQYHRFHSPVSGLVVDVKQIGGLIWGTLTAQAFYEERRRGAVFIHTDDFGLVALLPIGISTISSIEFSVKPGDSIRKGDELGYFKYGGSAVVMFFEPDAIEFKIPITDEGYLMKLGEELGVAKKA